MTRLTDGTSYLAAGSNVTITSASNGQITIAAASGGGSTSPGGSDTQLQFNDGGSFGGNSGLIFNKTSGLLTVAKGAVFNEGSNDADFRVESNGNENMLFVDGGNNKVGIGTAAPLTTLHISGSAATEAALTIQGQADVGIRLAADKANGDEGNNPYIDFYQDGQNPSSRNNRLANIAMEGDAGTSFSDSIANAFFIDTFCPNSTNAARQFQIATDTTKNGHNARLTIGGVRGNVGLHTAAPAEALHLSGAIRIDSQGRENLLIISGTAGTAATNSHQVFFLSGGAGASPRGHGDDTAFFVSGSVDSRGTAVKGTAVFGGDMAISGTLAVNLSDAAVGSQFVVTTDGKVGIGTSTPSVKLSVGGNMEVGEYIYHKNDADTFIRYQADDIEIEVGGKTMIKMSEGSLDQVLILSGGAKESADPKNFADTNFFVSGSAGSRGTSTIGTAVFGGDLVISGALQVQSATNFKPQLVDLGSGASGTITATSPLIFLDCDSIGAGGGGFFAATIATSGFSDGDTIRIVVTTDVNENLLFTTGILSDASKVFGIPAANAKGASFQLVYVASASAWAVLSHNGLATF